MDNQTVTCFIGGLPSGGAEHQLKELSGLLFTHGFRVQLVTFADVPDHYRVSDGIERIRIASGKTNIIKLFSIFIFFIKIKTNCVISYGQRASVYCLLPLVFRRKVKVLACERSCTLNRRPDRYEKMLLGGLYRRADWIVCNSYSQANHIMEVKPHLKAKIKTIINYIDLHEYCFSQPPENKVIKFGVFARYIKLKNYERLVKVVAKLKKQGYHFSLDWYGNIRDKNGMENQDYKQLKSLIVQYSINNMFLLYDHVPNTSTIMPQYDAICLASLWEGFSNTIAEAISCGRPLLASNISDNVVMVKRGINGFLFNPVDENEIYDAFVSFLSLDANHRKMMGENSRRIAESLFAGDAFLQSYISLIED